MRVLVYVLDRALAKRHGSDIDGLSVVHGDIFQCREAECMVTAGNSFGMMDGGIDGLTNYQFGMIEGRVQAAIAADPWRGELPVGAAVVLPAEPTTHRRFSYLCYAPTMRTPSACPRSINAYLAMRGALCACSAAGIRTLAVPLLCHGVGRMDEDVVIHQIRHALRTFTRPTPPDWEAISLDHHQLHREDEVLT
jgi:O-acetyl-ADP-ribose deacetylase (regulator of RNase III)